MNYYYIKAGVINPTEETKVSEIVESIKSKGWVGCPILTFDNGEMLLTGSHRLTALQLLDEEE